MPEQLLLDLPVRPALGREDFFISGSNNLAIAALEDWRNWPFEKLVIAGPSGSGKTHLAHVWANESDAKIVPIDALEDQTPDTLACQPLVIEDLDKISESAERVLFHIHNLMAANGHPLLITSNAPPYELQFALPDLGSRMQGTSVVTLDAPDDDLLAAVIVKRFSDLQLKVAPNVIPYLLHHMERSFEMAHRVIDALDNEAMKEGRAVTRALATQVLSKILTD